MGVSWVEEGVGESGREGGFGEAEETRRAETKMCLVSVLR